MDTRKPGTYGQCQHRGGRPMQSIQMRAPIQTPAASRAAVAAPKASAAALAQPQTAPATSAPTPPPPPSPAQFRRAYLSAYARDFTVTAESGKKAPLPLEAQRAEGGMALGSSGVAVPEDGYYMLLWELGVAGADGGATLQLGINDAASQLTYALRPGYDSGQQVTWLNAGDKLGLFAQAEDDKAEIHCGSAQITVIRLG